MNARTDNLTTKDEAMVTITIFLNDETDPPGFSFPDMNGISIPISAPSEDSGIEIIKPSITR